MQTQIGDSRAESKAQIGDLRTEIQVQFGDLRTESNAQIGDLRTEMQAQIAGAKSDLEDRIGALEVASERQYRQFLMWLIGTAITSTGVIIGAVAALVGPLP